MTEEVDFDLDAKFVLKDIIVLHRTRLGVRGRCGRGTTGLRSFESPFPRVAVLDHVAEIDEVERVIHFIRGRFSRISSYRKSG